jgi:AcrR family transcriptional regulator
MQGRRRNSDLDKRIEQTTLQLLATDGYHTFSLSRVAKHAHIGKAAIYRRYTSSEDLISAVLANQGAPMPDQTTDCKQDLITYLRGYRQTLEDVGFQVLGVLFASTSKPDLLQLHRERLIAPRAQYSRALLRRAQQLGHIDATANVDAIMEALVGSLWAHFIVGLSSARWPEDIIDVFWHDLPITSYKGDDNR